MDNFTKALVACSTKNQHALPPNKQNKNMHAYLVAEGSTLTRHPYGSYPGHWEGDVVAVALKVGEEDLGRSMTASARWKRA